MLGIMIVDGGAEISLGCGDLIASRRRFLRRQIVLSRLVRPCGAPIFPTVDTRHHALQIERIDAGLDVSGLE